LVTAAEVRPVGKEEVSWGELTRSSPSSARIRGYYLDICQGYAVVATTSAKAIITPRLI
jgi:hypothetical protein